MCLPVADESIESMMRGLRPVRVGGKLAYLHRRGRRGWGQVGGNPIKKQWSIRCGRMQVRGQPVQ